MSGDFQAKHGYDRDRVFNEYAMIQQLEDGGNITDFDEFERRINAFLDDDTAVTTFLADFAALFADDRRQQFLLSRYGFVP